jgi:hypothetical protein
MSHYVIDITQFGHTDWTRLDHDHPSDDPIGATYHGYYESRTWTNVALFNIHSDLMSNPLPEFNRVDDPGQLIRDMAAWINGRHGPDEQFTDADTNTVTLGSTYVRMLTTFKANWDAGTSYKGARGYDEELWNLSRENLLAGMNNLTNLWTSAYLDAHDRFLEDAGDIVVEAGSIDPPGSAYEGQLVTVTANVSNVGNASTGDFGIICYLDELEQIGYVILDLDPGEETTVSFSTTADAGPHKFDVVADLSQIVPESNESNNRWTVEYLVHAELHGSLLSAEPEALEMMQDDTGWFDLTLENTGNKDDVFAISLSAYTGTIDYSLTLHAEELLVAAGTEESFRIDVATRLENPVGPRFFTVVATGGNSTSHLPLVVIIQERQVAPFVEVEYEFYANISEAITFDATGSWDHNGDDITFAWDFGDGQTGEGAFVEHAYAIEGDYVIILNVSDGGLNRIWNLEVSIIDAVPPRPTLSLLDWDIDAVGLEWSTWDSSRYFQQYRIYANDSFDLDVILRPENLVANITLSYVDNTTFLLPWHLWGAEEVFVVLETVNTFGQGSLSHILKVTPEIRHAFRDVEWWDSTNSWYSNNPLQHQWVYVFNVTKTGFEVMWREWLPIGRGGYYRVMLWPPMEVNPTGAPMVFTVDDITITNMSFENLQLGSYYGLAVYYVAVDDDHDLRHSWGAQLTANLAPTLRTAPRAEAEEGVPFAFSLHATDPDGSLSRLVIDWGDGTSSKEIVPLGENYSLEHTYRRVGTFEINVTVIDDNDASGTTFTTVVVGESTATEPLGAYVALGLLAFLLVLFIFHYGRNMNRQEEEETFPQHEGELVEEHTAEEIVSELEEDIEEEPGEP